MAALVAGHAWERTPLGPRETWPASLRAMVDLVLASPAAMALAYGPQLRLIYNDGYRVLLADQHPRALGCPASEVFSELGEVGIGQLIEDVVRLEQPAQLTDVLLPIRRHGGLQEEAHFEVSYSPVYAEDGAAVGTFTVASEITGQVLAERRRATSVPTARPPRTYVRSRSPT
jgi:hypothetical protein